MGLLFLLPNILGFLSFIFIPLALSLMLAFSNWDLRLHNMFRDEPLSFVGLSNFTRLLGAPEFWRYLGNTLFLTAFEPGTGTELYKSDGTAQRTVPVQDVRAAGSSRPDPKIVV